jgi:OPA family sugar phosphate sensor protein UhpC-like MFS transporter
MKDHALRRVWPHYERWRWQIFAVTWLAYAGFYLTRKSFPVAKIEMGKPSGLALSAEWMAWIDGANLAAYAAGLFVCGVGGDRYGTRKMVLAGLLGSALTAAVMGASSVAWLLLVLYAVQGLWQSTGWAPLSKNVGYFFSQRERGTVMGLWSTNYAVGGFVGLVYAGYFGSLLGWRWAFYVPAATLFVIWLLFLIFQRNRPEDVGLPPVEEYHGEPPAVLAPPAENPSHVAEAGTRGEVTGQPLSWQFSLQPPPPRLGPQDGWGAPEGSWRAIGAVLQSPMVWLLAAVYFFMKPTRYAIMFWAPVYLNEKLGSEMLESGALSALFELAGALSVLVAGVLSDYLFGTRRNPISVMCLLGVAVLVFVLDRLPASRLMLGGCLFAIGFLMYAPDSLVSGTAAIDFGTKKGASTATGLVTGCGSVGAVAGGMLPGLLKDRLGWDGLFQILAASLAVAGLLLLPKWNAKPATVGQVSNLPGTRAS